MSDQSPLYMQIRHGGSLLHLDGHATEDSPPGSVRIPVHGIDDYYRHLCSKLPDRHEELAPVRPRGPGTRRDMNGYDPAKNLIVFWEVVEDETQE